MKRRVLILATAAAAGAMSACGGSDVTVLAQLEAATGAETTEAVALSALPVRLLPYDRDALFDSLAQAYAEPEPQLPDTMFELQQQVAERQREWQQANNRWLTLRDSLRTILDRMNRMDRSSGEYLVLFRDYDDLETEVNQLQRQADESFRDFEQLQNRLSEQSQEIRAARRVWSDEAYAPVDSIITARMEAMGREALADTTSAQGVARFRGVKSGRWWVHARYDRQFDELYWNEPIDVERGGEIPPVRLTEENAEVRPKL